MSWLSQRNLKSFIADWWLSACKYIIVIQQKIWYWQVAGRLLDITGIGWYRLDMLGLCSVKFHTSEGSQVETDEIPDGAQAGRGIGYHRIGSENWQVLAQIQRQFESKCKACNGTGLDLWTATCCCSATQRFWGKVGLLGYEGTWVRNVDIRWNMLKLKQNMLKLKHNGRQRGWKIR